MSPAFALFMVGMSTSDRSCYKIELLNKLRILSVAGDEKPY